MSISLFFAWYDFWIGAYYDRAERTLYVCLLPMVGVRIEFKPQSKPKGKPWLQDVKELWEHDPYPDCKHCSGSGIWIRPPYSLAKPGPCVCTVGRPGRTDGVVWDTRL
jgi:hypothetical protein